MQEDLWEWGLVRAEKYNNNCVAYDIRDYIIVIKKYFVLSRERKISKALSFMIYEHAHNKITKANSGHVFDVPEIWQKRFGIEWPADMTEHSWVRHLSSLGPMEVYVDDEAKLTLHGLQQHYVKLKENEKNKKLFELLDVLEFNQVVIFVKSVQRCMALAQLLTEQNFPAIGIHRGMTQEERLSRYQQFKDFQKRILVATNLFGRGMDIERVNIVFNYDMPEDSDTYLHRVARAGRFGTKGLAITLVSDENDAKILNDVQERFDVNITELPDEIDLASYIEGR
ncbi:hypothetical protein HZH68_003040 [Vespula germanica]|uniref:RNA helicase n=1 Tax=Vespula germanica TaxID=30212 RepID=A0A834U2A5_VESGE|nr:hypothetical protein HZH68_003040 [Vespula germanica]